LKRDLSILLGLVAGIISLYSEIQISKTISGDMAKVGSKWYLSCGTPVGASRQDRTVQLHPVTTFMFFIANAVPQGEWLIIQLTVVDVNLFLYLFLILVTIP